MTLFDSDELANLIEKYIHDSDVDNIKKDLDTMNEVIEKFYEKETNRISCGQ